MKRPACFQRQTGACRSYGVAVRQPCRGHEEPVEATDLSATGRRTPTDQVRTRRRERSVPESSGMRRSTPTARPVSSDGSDQLQSLNGCPAGEGLITPTAGLDRGRRATSIPSFRSVLPAKDQRQLRFGSIPSWESRGRANHPPVVPVQQGSRTQVSMVGNLGESQTVLSLSTSRDPQKRACDTPSEDCRQIVHKT